MVTFELCDKTVRKCKSEEEIKKILAYSYLLVIENEGIF